MPPLQIDDTRKFQLGQIVLCFAKRDFRFGPRDPLTGTAHLGLGGGQLCHQLGGIEHRHDIADGNRVTFADPDFRDLAAVFCGNIDPLNLNASVRDGYSHVGISSGNEIVPSE